MSMFHCNGCDKYLDSDIEGYHEIDEGVFYCDMCECKEHEDDFRDMIDQFRKMVKMGMG